MSYYFKRTETVTIPNPLTPSYRLSQDTRDRYATKPVGKEPAPYKRFGSLIMASAPQTWYDAPNTQVASAANLATSESIRASVVASDKALASLKEKAYASSQLGSTMAEWRSSVDMIADRAIQLRQAWSALRRGQLREFKRILKLDPKGPAGSKPSDAAKLWLEYWFGWSPLVADVYDSIDALQSELPEKLITSRGYAPFEYVLTHKRDFTWDWCYDRKGEVLVRLGARVRVSNPNLFRANQLGLINPASIAWELVPFSFLVDWFIPVGQFLDGWSMWAGLSLTQTFTTRFSKCKGSQWYVVWATGDKYNYTPSRAYYLRRDIGLPVYSWPFPTAMKTVSVTRAATACSLLSLALKNHDWIR